MQQIMKIVPNQVHLHICRKISAQLGVEQPSGLLSVADRGIVDAPLKDPIW